MAPKRIKSRKHHPKFPKRIVSNLESICLYSLKKPVLGPPAGGAHVFPFPTKVYKQNNSAGKTTLKASPIEPLNKKAHRRFSFPIYAFQR